MPNFPAEIRAPAGTIAGVSSFQVHISDHDIVTPGDAPNVLVAMNPAALKANLAEMPPGSTLLVNSDAFDDRNLSKVGYDVNPLDDGSLSAYRVIQVPMTSLTLEACKELGVKPRDAERSKNFFALGLISWMYTRPVDPTLEWIDQKYGSRQIVVDANVAAFKAGLHFGETAELARATPTRSRRPRSRPGKYRNISGNLGDRVRAARRGAAGEPADPLRVVPDHAGVRHPARAVEPQELRRAHAAGRRRDRRRSASRSAPRSPVSSASPPRAVPGVDLKSEGLGLAMSLELPLLLIDVQRGGPSTGLPTKTEQSDLLLAMYGRHGEAPVPIIAARSPSHCFDGRVRGGAHRARSTARR